MVPSIWGSHPLLVTAWVHDESQRGPLTGQFGFGCIQISLHLAENALDLVSQLKGQVVRSFGSSILGNGRFHEAP
jgi:hypothetical protein